MWLQHDQWPCTIGTSPTVAGRLRACETMHCPDTFRLTGGTLANKFQLNTQVLKQSWDRVTEYGDDVALWFYEYLFHAYPQTRDLFPLGMAQQRDRLLTALGRILSDVDTTEDLVPFLAQLGQDHRKFGTLAEHYPPVGKSLLATLAHFLGPAWTDSVAAQWQAAYDLIADVMIGAANDASNDAPAWWDGRILKRDQRYHDVAVLTLQTEPALEYIPGQSITVEAPTRPRLWRYYSPANAPRADGSIDLHVRALPGGQVSGALVRELGPGDTVRIGPCVGQMRIDPDGVRDILFIGGGTGLAPMKAMLDHLTDPAVRNARRVHLYFGARTSEELYDKGDLDDLALDHSDWLTVSMATSDDRYYQGKRGHLCDVVIRDNEWVGHEAYICGPPAMVETTIGSLRLAGVPDELIHTDPYVLT